MGVTKRKRVREDWWERARGEFELIEDLVSFANTNDPRSTVRAAIQLTRDFASEYFDKAPKNGAMVMHAAQQAARRWLSYVIALERAKAKASAHERAHTRERRKIELEHGRRLEDGSVTGAEAEINECLAACDVQLWTSIHDGVRYERHVVVDADPIDASALIVAILLDRSRDPPYARRLGQCRHDGCGRFFFQSGGIQGNRRQYCLEHDGDSLERAAARVAAWREKKRKKAAGASGAEFSIHGEDSK